MSANWLTYPGEGQEESLELAAALGFDVPLAPEVLAFYDMDFEDWGVEALAGPEWQAGDYTLLAAPERASFRRANSPP